MLLGTVLLSAVVIIALNKITVAGDSIFTTTNDLRTLSKLEDNVLEKLVKHLQRSEERLKEVKRFVNDLKLSSRAESPRPVLDIAGHPIDAFLLVKDWHSRDKFGSRYFPDKAELVCENENDMCEEWASIGECSKNPAYMLLYCKPACHNCNTEVVNINDEINDIFEDVQHYLPTENDVLGATEALLRLQLMYNLTARQLSSGSLFGVQAVSGLNFDDCIHLGMRAEQILGMDRAMEWYQEAKTLVSDRQTKHTVLFHIASLYEKKHEFNNAIDTAMEAFDETPPTLNCVDMSKDCGDLECSSDTDKAQNDCSLTCGYCQPPQLSDNLQNILASIIARSRKSDEHKNVGKRLDLTYEKEKMEKSIKSEGYAALCQSNVLGKVSEKPDKKLYCKFYSSSLPWYRFKAEVISISPFISVFYEVVHDSEVDEILKYAKENLVRSKVVMSENGDRMSRRRISKQAWLSDQSNPLILKLSQRIAMATGLIINGITEVDTPNGLEKLHSSDSYQVVNYGIGGHYDLHHDFVQYPWIHPHLVHQQHVDMLGDRMATFMVYLNHVWKGGNTVFPKLNISIPPVKNGAAFWYNAAPSGEYDDLTFHGGCPVLLGEKWVMNKWVREFSNQFSRKCGLHKGSIQEF